MGLVSVLGWLGVGTLRVWESISYVLLGAYEVYESFGEVGMGNAYNWL